MSSLSLEKANTYTMVEEAIGYLEEHYLEQLSLDEVASRFALSPFHFQRIFSEWAGVSPKKFIQYLTIEFLKTRLSQPGNLIEAAMDAGLSSQSRVYDLFTTLEAVTPEEYREKGAGLLIQYGFHLTPFGHCLIGVTNRGICWLSFLPQGAREHHALADLKKYWSNSETLENPDLTLDWVNRIFGKTLPTRGLHLYVKGTNFQVKVWQALLEIPAGTLTTYQSLAKSIDNPHALQAVGSAVGANHVAWLIPCHRVIRKSGVIGEYRWSTPRKKSMIGWEMSHVHSDRSASVLSPETARL